MAFNDEFTGTNGDPIGVSWTVQGGILEIQENQITPKTLDASEPKCLATIDGGDPDGVASLDVKASAQNAHGVVFRYQDGDNFLGVHLRFYNKTVVLYKREAGVESDIATYSFPTMDTSTLYNISADFNGTSIAIDFNGTPDVITATSSLFLTSQLHGIRFGNTFGQSDNFSFTEATPAAGTISIQEATYSNKVYQRNTPTTAPVSFNVTYTGTPTGLQYRLLDASDDTTEIVTWTTFDASPSGGTATLTFNAPISTTAYHVQVRHTDSPATLSLQATDWFAGAVVVVMGQSLSKDLLETGSITAQAGHFSWDKTNDLGVVPTTGAGEKAIADALIGAENMAVLIINSGFDSTALTAQAGDASYWNAPSGSYWQWTKDHVVNATTDNRIEFAWWHQGSRDAANAVSKADYLTAMQEFFPKVRAEWTSGSSGTLKIISAIFARDTREAVSDSERQAIRSAQLDYSASDAEFYPVNTFTMEMVDGLHGTPSSYGKLGGEIVCAYYYAIGTTSIYGPHFVSVTQGDTTDKIDITYDFDLLSTDTNYSIEGVRVELNGSPLTILSFTRKSEKIATITLAADPSAGQITIYVGYGGGETNDELIHPRSENIVLPNTGGTYNLSAIPLDAIVLAEANTPPTITAMTSLTDVAANTVVEVTATVTPGTGTISSYAWTQTSGAETVTLTGSTTATVGFTTPAAAQTTVLTLLVTDSNGETDTETWSVTNLAVVLTGQEITPAVYTIKFKG